MDAIALVASLEGLLFDPVYSGKALAAMIDQVTLGNFDDAQRLFAENILLGFRNSVQTENYSKIN